MEAVVTVLYGPTLRIGGILRDGVWYREVIFSKWKLYRSG